MSRPLRITLFVTLALAVLLGGGYLWLRMKLYSGIGNELDRRFHTLTLSDLTLRYDSLHIGWFKGTVALHGLVLEQNPYDTTCLYPEFISARRVRAEGLSLTRLVFRNTVAFDRVTVDSAHVHLRAGHLFAGDPSAQKEEERQNDLTLAVGQLRLNAVRFTRTDSARCETQMSLAANVAADRLWLDFRADQPLAYQVEDISVTAFTAELPQAHYRMASRGIRYIQPEQTLTIDSFSVKPTLPPTAFARSRGYEVDRIEAEVPFIRLRAFTFGTADSAFVNIANADVRFFLKVFRDKRFPFKAKIKPLPIEQLRKLPFTLQLDTLRVTHSYAEYVEFPEKAEEAGKVFFDNLFATFVNVTNRYTGHTNFSAQSDLSGDGRLALHVTIPLDDGTSTRARGSITNFDLPRINAMLTPSTNLKIESGHMEELAFDFRYDEKQSDGELSLRYQDLKIVQFKDGENGLDEDANRDNLKTFIMNTFIFRTNMDEDVPRDKRTGAIAFTRDETRSVFNYWVKSLVSGLKDAYNLEKAGGAVGKKARELRREERLARREARKAQRKRNKG